MNRLTASALTRGEMCTGSIVLPGIRESGRWAATGNAVDRFVQRAKLRGVDVALADAPESLRQYLGILAGSLDRIPDGAEYQVAFAMNALTGEVRRIANREDGYPEDMGPEWIFGSTDIVGVREAQVMIWDIKWGSYTVGRDPEDDLQLGFYGVCAAALAGVDEAELTFGRAGWDGVLRPESAVLDGFELAAMKERVVEIWRRAKAADEQFLNDGIMHPLHVGDWCGYCPARRNCDAMAQPVALALRAEIDALAGEQLPALDVVRDRVVALDQPSKGRLYSRIEAAIEYLSMVKNIVRDDAKQAPIPLAGGKELRLVQWGKRVASPEAMRREAALEEELRAAGEVQTIKSEQVRPMKAQKAAR